MGSIGTRVSALLVLGSGLLLACSALILQLLVAARVQNEFDHGLLVEARALATLTKHTAAGVRLDFADELMPDFEALEGASYFQLQLASGALLEASRSLGSQRLPRLGAARENPQYRDLPLPDGRAGRLVEIAFQTQIEPQRLRARLLPVTAIVQVARSREALDGLQRNLAITIASVSLVLMVGLTLLGYFGVRHGLRPLFGLSRQLSALDVRNLDSQLATSSVPAELEPLVTQFNAMLVRLHRAFALEQQFSAHVAHEFRTPLAELRALAEVGARWANDPRLVATHFTDMLAVTAQMERLVAAVLALARHGAGSAVSSTAPAELGALIAAAWTRVESAARRRELRFERSGLQRLDVARGRDEFEGILNNLFDNAVAYSPVGGVIVCTLTQHGTHAMLSLMNTATDLDHSDLSHLFQQFWRKDPARANGDHTGMGLALVAAFADLVGFDVSATLDAECTLCITLSGPVSPAS